MLKLWLLIAVALAALLASACGGEGEAPPTLSPTLAATSEDQIREVLDRLAGANSQEDSSAAYEIYAPSLREACQKDEFLAVRELNFRSDKLFIGEIAWEALKEDLADGYEVQSIEVMGDQATAVVLENDEPLTFVREEGQWWYYEEEPCAVTLFEDIFGLFEDSDDLSDLVQEVYTILLEDFVDPEAVRAILPEDFVNPETQDPELLELSTINGILQALGDPHTVYIDPESYALGIDAISGTFEGIGAQVEQDPVTGDIVIVTPFRDSPAEKAGIRPGDIVRSVDGEPTDGWTVAQAVRRFRGPEGTQVVLGIEHSDGSTEDVPIVRGTFVIPTVFTPDIEDAAGNPVSDLAYIELQQFTDQAVRDVHTELERIDQEGYRGVILDLRRNPGGSLDATIQVADMFLDNGIIITEVGREGSQSVTQAQPGGAATDIPVVLLVGPGSASESEVLACALSDNERATLIGERTFGKSSISQLRELSNGGALYLTIARWVCPGGQQIEALGIQPDVEIAATEADVQADRDTPLFAAIQYLRN